MSTTNKTLLIAALILLLQACASAPKPLRGEFSELGPEQVVSANAINERVRWGGLIISATPNEKQTCFEVLSRELNSAAKPLQKDSSNGRFIACRDGFYDPAVFSGKRQITVTGTVREISSGKIGELNYQYANVAAETIFLWPEYDYNDAYFQTGPSLFWGFGFHQPRIYHVRHRSESKPKPNPDPKQ